MKPEFLYKKYTFIVWKWLKIVWQLVDAAQFSDNYINS